MNKRFFRRENRWPDYPILSDESTRFFSGVTKALLQVISFTCFRMLIISVSHDSVRRPSSPIHPQFSSTAASISDFGRLRFFGLTHQQHTVFDKPLFYTRTNFCYIPHGCYSSCQEYQWRTIWSLVSLNEGKFLLNCNLHNSKKPNQSKLYFILYIFT